jgi:hypothetical protein
VTDPLAPAPSFPPQAPFPVTSRYAGLEVAKVTLPDGREAAYVRRRFVPPPERFSTLAEEEVEAGERVDGLAARHLGDPLQWWRLCDANGAMRGSDLEVAGRRIRITLPEGIPLPPADG